MRRRTPFATIASVLTAIVFVAAGSGQATAATVSDASSTCTASVGNATGVSMFVDANDRCVLYFKNPGTTTWDVPDGVTNVDVLLVGGGGGGGGTFDTVAAGGGGGGGMREWLAESVASGATVSVTVGAGGAGGAGATNAYGYPGTNGGNSAFGSLSVAGGGGGGGGRGSGLAGGSGGGGGGRINTLVGGAGTAGEGNDGGRNTTGGFLGGGGGGGKGSAGSNTTTTAGATGGSGADSTIDHVAVTYAAGGSGATHNVARTGAAGAANTGNGGQGAGCGSSCGRAGGAGGSGIVVVRYSAAAVATTTTAPATSTTVAATTTVAPPTTAVSSTTTTPMDTSSPAVVSTAPADGATNVTRNPTLSMTFSEPVTTVANKYLTIYKLIGTQQIEQIAVSDASQVTVSGSTVTVDPSVTLNWSTIYFVRVDTGSFRDPAGNGFAGIWDSTDWNFTTDVDPTPSSTTTTTTSPATTLPGASTTSIAAGATTVAPTTTRASSPSAAPAATLAPSTTGAVAAGQATTTTDAISISGEPTATTTTGQGSLAPSTSAQGARTTTALPQAATTSTSATTIASTPSSTTTTIPDAPVSAGAFTDDKNARVALIDGTPVEVATKTEAGTLVTRAGSVAMTIAGTRRDGEAVMPNADGTLPVRRGDELVVNVEGFRAYADLDVWVYSDPTYLGKVVASVDGRALFEGVVPDLTPGLHDVVVDGVSAEGAQVTLATQLLVLEDLSTGPSVARRIGTTAVWVLLAGALLAGLFLPTRTRKRREQN